MKGSEGLRYSESCIYHRVNGRLSCGIEFTVAVSPDFASTSLSPCTTGTSPLLFHDLRNLCTLVMGV